MHFNELNKSQMINTVFFIVPGEPKKTAQAPIFTCGRGYFTCQRSKRCIASHWVCDKERDCIDGSDEIGCGKHNNDNSNNHCNFSLTEREGFTDRYAVLQ